MYFFVKEILIWTSFDVVYYKSTVHFEYFELMVVAPILKQFLNRWYRHSNKRFMVSHIIVFREFEKYQPNYRVFYTYNVLASTHAQKFVGYLAKKAIDFQLNIKSFNYVNQTFEYSDIALLGSRHIWYIWYGVTKTGQERKKQTHRPNEIADFGLFPVNPVFP